MRSMWTSLKGLAVWQILVLLVVLFGAAGATYGGYIRANGQESVELAEGQQLIPIRYGNLVNEVSTSGNLVFPNREMLTFGSGGAVSQLVAEEGMPVSAGQVLASLNDSALAALAETKATAELELQTAIEALEEARTIDPLALATARENVAAARLTVQEALDALEDALTPHTAAEIESQRKLIADTELALQNSRQELVDLRLGHEVQLAEAGQAEADARSALKDAHNGLADFAPSHDLQVVLARQAVADAESELDSTLISLADFNPSYSEALALARQADADARVALVEAINSLETFNSQYGQQLAQARTTRADKELALQDAMDALDDLNSGHARRLSEARQALSDAQLGLEQATTALERFEESNRRRIDNLLAERKEFEASLEETQLRLTNLLLAQGDGVRGLTSAIRTLEFGVSILEERLAELDESLSGWDRVVVAEELAQRILDDARADLARLEPGPEPLEVAQQTALVESAETELQTAIDDLWALETDGGSPRQKQLEASAKLAEQTRLRTAADLAKLESGPNAVEFRQLEAKLESGRAAVSQALLDLQQLLLPAASDIIAAWELRVSQAEQAVAEAYPSHTGSPDPAEAELTLAADWLTTAQEILAALSQGAGAEELAVIEAKAASAKAQLAEARGELDRLAEGPDPRQTAALQAEETHLAAALDQARVDLAELLEGPDNVELAFREAQIVLARAALADAEETLAEIQEGADPVRVALLEAQVRSAALAVQDAELLLTNAVLKSPFDGFVSQVLVEAGEDVQRNTEIVEVVDPAVVEVDGIVDEIDVLSLQLGTLVRVTVDAIPGETIEGTVTQISPGATNQQGVVTYPITIQVRVRPGLDLREGLSAVASIVLREERDVLLVPQQALYGTFDEPIVRLLSAGGTLEDRAVVLGASDEFWVSVEQGLQEGDQVAMVASDVGTSQFSFRQFRRVTGGGGPPGRGGRGGSR